MRIFKRAFTLTELLVALGVVSVLCAILMPIVNNMRPNQNTLMAKRAYYTVQSIVSELINDDACYPDKTASTTDMRVGFDDYFGYPNCRTTASEGRSTSTNCRGSDSERGWDGTNHTEANCDETSHDSVGGAAFDKFTRLFIDRLGRTPDCSTANNYCRFTTRDGMDWAFYRDNDNKNFLTPAVGVTTADELAGRFIFLVVDVNGSKEPNCASATESYSDQLGSGSNSSCAGRTSGFDRFQLKIRGNGQIEFDPSDSWASEAVTIDKNITAD